MAFTKVKVTLPTCIFILISVVLSIMAVNYYKIDLHNNNGLIVEGMCGGGCKGHDHKKSGCDCGCKADVAKENSCDCGCDKGGDSGRPFFLMEGMHNKEDHKVEEEEEEVKAEDLASVSAFTTSLLN